MFWKEEAPCDASDQAIEFSNLSDVKVDFKARVSLRSRLRFVTQERKTFLWDVPGGASQTEACLWLDSLFASDSDILP